MDIIDKSMRDEVMKHYDPAIQPLLNKQIDYMNNFIGNNILRYKHSTDFRNAVDMILADMLNGKMLGG